MTNTVTALRKMRLHIVLLSSIAVISTLAAVAATQSPAMADVKNGPQILDLLQKIYALPSPTGFQQIDVSARVIALIPKGTTRLTLIQALKPVTSSRVVEDSPGKLVVRDDRGRAMLDPDARSVIITVSFNKDDKVSGVHAVYLRNQ